MSSPVSANNLFSFIQHGGPVMWPLLGLSIMTLGVAIERAGYWIKLLGNEDRIVHDVLEAANYSLEDAAKIAYQARNVAIGRFLFDTLRLSDASPETFHLAMEAAAEREFIQMRKGDKMLETVVAIAPLLGLLGTVTGLMLTFSHLNLGGGKAAAEGLGKAAAGIGEALIATATGMIVAILALVFFRIFVSLQAKQLDYFTNVGNQLELIYRHVWCEGQGIRYSAEESSQNMQDISSSLQIPRSALAPSHRAGRGRRIPVSDFH